MSQSNGTATIPELVGDEDDLAHGTWLRADGRSRGQAQAIIAGEIGCGFTDVRLTVDYLRPDGTDAEVGVPRMAACAKDSRGAVRYWRGRYIR